MTKAEPGGVADPVKFRVAWRSRDTKYAGHGQPVRRAIAEASVKSANQRRPTVEHWVEEAGLVDAICGPGRVQEIENRYPGTVPWVRVTDNTEAD